MNADNKAENHEALLRSMEPPIYPREAAREKTQGYVTLEFTLNETGSTEDIRVIESVPPGTFDAAAIDAVSQYSFWPRQVNGKMVRGGEIRSLIKFEFDK